MNQIIPPKVLRILFALPFLVFGAFHFMGAQQMKGMVPAYIPGGILWIYITGGLLILTALAMIVNKFAKAAGYILGTMLLVFILTIHGPAVIAGDQAAIYSLLKDFSLMAGAMFIANFSAK